MTFNPTNANDVDSPIPSTPLDAAPVDVAQDGVDVSLEDNAGVGEDQGGASTLSPEKQEIDQLSETFGVDLSRFSSVSDARAAAQILAQQYADIAASQPPQQNYAADWSQPQPQYAGPSQQQVDHIDRLLADDTLSPEAKAALQAAKAHQQHQLYQAQQIINYQQNQYHQFARAQVDSMIDAELDKLSNSQFGVGGDRTFFQESSRQAFRQQIWNFAENLARSGKKVPTADKLVRIFTAAQAGQTAPKAQGAALLPRSQGTSNGKALSRPPVNQNPNDPLDILRDKDFRAGLAAIKARN